MHDRMSEKDHTKWKKDDLQAENLLGMKFREKKACLGGEKAEISR